MAPAILDSPPAELAPEQPTPIQDLKAQALNQEPSSPLKNGKSIAKENGTTQTATRNGVKASTYPGSGLSLIDRYVDEPRSLRVGVIGGGLAGILAGILLPAKVPGIQLTIYEKNKDFVSSNPSLPGPS